MKLISQAWKLSPAARISRRAAIALTLAAVAVFESPEVVEARAIHGGMAVSGGGGGGNLLTTLTLANTSGSTQAAGFITPLFGHSFVQGQIPAGTAPQFQLTNGTNVPFSMSVTPTTWPDGSLDTAQFLLRVPSSVPGSGNITINVLSGGTTPTPSGMTNSVFTTGSDLGLEMVGLDNLSGTWLSSLNQGVTLAAGDNLNIVDGDAGIYRRIRAPARQSSADHGYLEVYWYAIATRDSGGGLGGIRYLPNASMPWDANGLGPGGSNPNWVSFSSVKIKDGATLIADHWDSTLSNVQNFNWTAGTSYNVANSNNQIGCALRLTTNGVLPKLGTFTGSITGTTLTGLYSGITGEISVGCEIFGTGIAANTYVTKNLGSLDGGVTFRYTVSTSQSVASTSITARLPTGRTCFVGAVGTNTLTIQNPSSYGGTYMPAGTNVIDNGTGTHTMQSYPYLPPFCSMPCADADGKYRYIQGGGSIAADCTIRVIQNKYHLRQTTKIGSFDFRNVSATDYPGTFNYQINGAGPVERNPELTGAAPNVGLFPRYQSQWLFTQSAAGEKLMRVSGYTLALSSLNIRRKASNGTIICVNNGPNNAGASYSGMMTPSPNYNGDIVPVDDRMQTIGFFNTTTHGPNLPYLPYLITGQQEYADMMLQQATSQVSQHQNGASAINISTTHYSLADGGGRNIDLGNGTTVYGAMFGTSSTRYDAWMLRNIVCASAFAYPDTPSYRSYMLDLVAATGNLIARAIALSPTTYLQTWGLWLVNHAYYTQPFMHNYTMITLLHAWNLTGNTNIKNGAQKLINWWNHVTNIGAAYSSLIQNQVIVKPNTTYDGPLLTDDLAIAGSGPNIRWTNGSSTFSMDPRAQGDSPRYTPAVGDIIYWVEDTPSQTTVPIPAACTYYVPYYILSVGAPVANIYPITLTTTKSVAFGGPGGGSAIVNTDSDPGGQIEVYFRPGTQPSTGGYSFPADTGAPLAQHRGVLNMAVASGLTVDTTARAEILSRWASTGSNFNGDVTWAFTDSFQQAA